MVRSRGFEVVSKYSSEASSILMPRRGTRFSACYDIFNNTGKEIVIEAGQISKAIPTKIKAYMLEDEVLMAYVRSGHGFKYSVRLANSTGIIDSDYYKPVAVMNKKGEMEEGEIFVKLHNQGNDTLTIGIGEAMAQMMFQKYLIADDDESTVGGDRLGGFGSTSK
jgi:dUTP pyrophosphatase